MWFRKIEEAFSTFLRNPKIDLNATKSLKSTSKSPLRNDNDQSRISKIVDTETQFQNVLQRMKEKEDIAKNKIESLRKAKKQK